MAATRGPANKGHCKGYLKGRCEGLLEGHAQRQCIQCSAEIQSLQFRRTQEGCGGLGGENPAAFPKAGPIFQQPFSLPESAQTLAGIAFRAAGKSGNIFPAASKFAGKLFSREKLHTPPPSPHFWPKGIFQGRGVGVYILRPHAAGILYAPPFYTPPTPRRVFSGVGGWGCVKFGPVFSSKEFRTATAFSSFLSNVAKQTLMWDRFLCPSGSNLLDLHTTTMERRARAPMIPASMGKRPLATMVNSIT